MHGQPNIKLLYVVVTHPVKRTEMPNTVDIA